MCCSGHQPVYASYPAWAKCTTQDFVLNKYFFESFYQVTPAWKVAATFFFGIPLDIFRIPHGLAMQLPMPAPPSKWFVTSSIEWGGAAEGLFIPHPKMSEKFCEGHTFTFTVLLLIIGRGFPPPSAGAKSKIYGTNLIARHM